MILGLGKGLLIFEQKTVSKYHELIDASRRTTGKETREQTSEKIDQIQMD